MFGKFVEGKTNSLRFNDIPATKDGMAGLLELVYGWVVILTGAF